MGLLALILAGCNMPSRVSEPEDNPALTHAAQTVEAQSTINALTLPPPTATDAGSQNPTITLAPTATLEPSITPVPTVCDAAGFIQDVTIPDGTEMMPGETFTKTWRLSNEGDCEWNSAYELAFDEGAAMGGPVAVSVTKGTVAPNAQVDVSVELTAPSDPGVYRGTWQMRNDLDEVFTTSGFWVEIEVLEPEIFTSKSSFQIDQGDTADLDNGDSPAAGVEDFVYNVASPNDKRIEPVNTAEFLVMGEDKPEYGTCSDAELEDDPIPVDADLVGQWVCYVTSEGRIGRFEVVSLNPEDISQVQTLVLRYVTWRTP
jgi:hypothetical protein